jgi:hypothetical protein
MDPLSEPSIFSKFLGNSPMIRVLDILLESREIDYSKKEMAEAAGVSWNTLASVWPFLLEKGIIMRTRKIGKQEMYMLDRENVLVLLLTDFYDSLLGYMVETSSVKGRTSVARIKS